MEDTEAQKRLNEVDARVSVLEESVNRAVGTLMPKVDALLAERSNREEASSEPHTSTSASASTSLVEMAKRGDYDALLSLLADPGIDLQKNPRRNENGDTALHVAASEGHVKAVMVLLGAGARVNALGCQLRTPLHCAAAQGHLAVAQRLLIAGALVDAKDADGHTPLDLAAGQGRWDLLERLVQEGKLSVDMCNEGVPLIVLAAKANRWGMVEVLLEKGASATTCKDAKESALVWASKGGQADAVRHLLRRGASSNSEQVQWALRSARNAAVVWAFMDVLPDEVRGRSGEFGFRQAGVDGRLETLIAFLQAGVNINATCGNNGTALFYASSNRHLACVRELLQRGADVNTKHAFKSNTPLHAASLKGHVECVRALLDAGASTTERNKEGKIPLEIAGSEGVRALLTR